MMGRASNDLVRRAFPFAVVAAALAFVSSVTGATPIQTNGRLAFTKTMDAAEIWIMQADGSRKTRLVANLGMGYEGVTSPDGRWLVYVSDRDGDTEIYVAHADGRAPRQLTHNQGIDFDPAWSPDGKTLAFASDRTGSMEIYSMKPDGTALRRLTRRAGADENPAWSPDGKRIAFWSDRAGSADIYTMGPDGRAVRRLTATLRDEYFPAWSPDGATIAYTLWDDGNEVWVMHADGSAQRRLLDSGVKPQWSKDGTRLVYADDDGDICVVDADGKHVHRIAEYGGSPSWAGPQIVYTRKDFANDEIASVDVAGTAEQRLTTYDGYDGHPTWSPDGTTVVFTRAQPDAYDRLYAVDERGNLRPLADLAMDEDEASWSPDGTRLAFVGYVSGESRIVILTVATGEIRALDTYGGEAADWDPAWSPDGRSIAFSSRRGGSYDLYVYDTVGAGLRRLTFASSDDWHPTWSPDGTMIAFASDAKGSFDIWVVAAAGGTPRRLTTGAMDDDDPVWSPDGTLIAFDRTLEDETCAVYTMPADGGGVSRVTSSPEPAYEPAWQPVLPAGR